MKGAKTVDEYVENAGAWRAGLERLREILISLPLEEEVKWGAPCYTHAGKNVVGMAAFKDYFGLWFHQGALLSDPEEVLINAQEGRTKALRQWRMSSTKEIKARAIKAYVQEAMALVDAGQEIKPDRAKPVVVPPELKAALAKHAKAKAAFARLTPGRRREYADHVAEAKREATRLARVEKILPMIVAGLGLNDRYRSC